MAAGRPILVTGSHRSGSTWTGKMLAFSPHVLYLQEPFNEHYYNPGTCRAYFDIPFCYVTEDNEQKYLADLQRTVSLKYNWRESLAHTHGLKNYLRIGLEGFSFLRHRLTGGRPLFKDPFALLSTEWLVNRFNMQPVILIRHPAAFTSSVKRFNWESPVHLLLQQNLLMRDYLEPLRQDIEAFLSQPRSIVEQAAQFWKMLYFVVDIFRQRHPEWYFVRHEDLSANPKEEFRKIFAYLNLPYTTDIVNQIQDYTNAKNPKFSQERTTVVKLNSQANIWSWKKRLTPEEVARIREIAGEMAAKFGYDDEMWG